MSKPKQGQTVIMDRIDLTDEHYILGYIRDGKIDIHDIVHNNQSEVDLTGEKPGLRPIPLEEFEKRGFKPRYSKVEVRVTVDGEIIGSGRYQAGGS